MISNLVIGPLDQGSGELSIATSIIDLHNSLSPSRISQPRSRVVDKFNDRKPPTRSYEIRGIMNLISNSQ